MKLCYMLTGYALKLACTSRGLKVQFSRRTDGLNSSTCLFIPVLLTDKQCAIKIVVCTNYIEHTSTNMLYVHNITPYVYGCLVCAYMIW